VAGQIQRVISLVLLGSPGKSLVLVKINCRYPLCNRVPYVLDYAVRNKIGGENLAKFIIRQFPFISIPADFIKIRTLKKDKVLKLTYNFFDLKEFAKDLNNNR